MPPDPLPEASDPRTYAIIGAAMEVHREMGNGYLEPVYHETMEMEMEMADRAIPNIHEMPLVIHYKGRQLKTGYRPDFLCFDSIVLELKTVSQLTKEHDAQVLNYLKTTGLEVGLLINFGAPSLQYKRLVRSRKSDE